MPLFVPWLASTVNPGLPSPNLYGCGGSPVTIRRPPSLGGSCGTDCGAGAGFSRGGVVATEGARFPGDRPCSSRTSITPRTATRRAATTVLAAGPLPIRCCHDARRGAASAPRLAMISATRRWSPSDGSAPGLKGGYAAVYNARTGSSQGSRRRSSRVAASFVRLPRLIGSASHRPPRSNSAPGGRASTGPAAAALVRTLRIAPSPRRSR
jgi:hypothetical protein